MLGDELVGTTPFAGEVIVDAEPQGRSASMASALPHVSVDVTGLRAKGRSIALALPSPSLSVHFRAEVLSRALAQAAAMVESGVMACPARSRADLHGCAVAGLGLHCESASSGGMRCFVRCQGGGLCVDFRHDMGVLPQIIFQ